MNNNPFENASAGNYVDFVRNQVASVNVGESIKADLGGKKLPSFRMTLRYVSEGTGFKFKTKSNSDGELWIKRVL